MVNYFKNCGNPVQIPVYILANFCGKKCAQLSFKITMCKTLFIHQLLHFYSQTFTQ